MEKKKEEKNENERRVFLGREFIWKYIARPNPVPKRDPASVRNREPNLYVAESKLQVPFEKGKKQGLFTKTDIPREGLIADAFDPKHLSEKINDVLVDLAPVIKASTSEEMENAVWEMVSNYETNQERLNRVNSVLTYTAEKKDCYFVALKPIAANEEIVRAYTPTYWLSYLYLSDTKLCTLTTHTLIGYANAISRILPLVQHPGFRSDVTQLDIPRKVSRFFQVPLPLPASNVFDGICSVARIPSVPLAQASGRSFPCSPVLVVEL